MEYYTIIFVHKHCIVHTFQLKDHIGGFCGFVSQAYRPVMRKVDLHNIPPEACKDEIMCVCFLLVIFGFFFLSFFLSSLFRFLPFSLSVFLPFFLSFPSFTCSGI